MKTTYTFKQIAENSTKKVKPQESDKEHYIGLEHIDPECLYITRWGADAAPIGEKLVMKKGDVLFGKRRAYQRKVGIAPFDGIFSAHGLVLRPKEDVICKEFFPFFISSDVFLDRAVQISVGGLSPTINWSDLARQEFELPSLEEQKVLAEKLWAAYKLKESYRQLLTTTDEMVKAKFQKMFGEVEINETLGKYVDVKTGKLDSNAANKDGVYPFFTCSSETLQINTYAFDCEAVLLAGNGEFSVKYYEGKFNAYQRTYVIQSKNKNVLSVPFLFYWFSEYAKILKQQAIGGVIKYIKLNYISDAKFYLPSLEEQQQFVAIATQVEATKASLRQSIESIDRVIRSLINQ